MPTKAPNQTHAGVVDFDLKVNGAALMPKLRDAILRIEVDSTLNRPDLCTISFLANQLTDMPIKPGAELKVGATRTQGSVIFSGEVTTVELGRSAAEHVFTIVAYDKRHRLYRTVRTETYLRMTASDIVGQIAGRHRLDIKKPAVGSVRPHIVQNAMTDGDFIERLAREQGWSSTWEGNEMVLAAKSTDGNPVAELVANENLDTYNVRWSADSWLPEVTVSGWDPVKKEAIVGKAKQSKESFDSRTTKLGSKFGTTPPAGLPRSVLDQTGAERLAQAELERALASARQLEGICIGDERLAVGKVVEVKGAGTECNGKYLLTSVRHEWAQSTAYVTHFACQPGTERSVARITGGANGAPEAGAGARIRGVVTALVTDTNDPDDLGRVTVKYPWMDDLVSGWIRIAAPGGGKKKGFYWLPDVNDEVLVAFEHGDVNRGYVLGGLFNAKDKPPVALGTAADKGATVQRVLRTAKGHQITLNESKDLSGLELITANKNIIVTLDEKNNAALITTKSGNKITITSSGDVTIKSDGSVTIEATKDINMKATGDINLSATKNVAIKATMNAEIEATVGATVKGATTTVGSGTSVTSVSGSMVKIN